MNINPSLAKLYKYIGAESIRLASANSPVGQEIRTQKDIKNWIQQTNQPIL